MNLDSTEENTVWFSVLLLADPPHSLQGNGKPLPSFTHLPENSSVELNEIWFRVKMLRVAV